MQSAGRRLGLADELIAELDVVLFRDPMPYVRRDLSLQVSMDFWCGKSLRYQHLSHRKGTYHKWANAGVWYLKAHAPSVAFFTKLVDEMKSSLPGCE